MPVFGFIQGIGATELVVILVVVLVIFGPGKLPQAFESFGKSIKAFRDAQKDEPPRARLREDVDADEVPAPRAKAPVEDRSEGSRASEG